MSETRWLDGDEQRTWRTFMFANKLLFEQFDRDLRRGAAMPTTYYEVLVRLSEAPERRLRMSQLAERSQSSRSHLTHTITSLQRLGWVDRESCPTDRRGAFAVLTDTGFSALEGAAHVHVESVRSHLFDQLDSDQLEQLEVISEQLLRHLISLQEPPTAESSLLEDVVPRAPFDTLAIAD
jgi:DNA-binding MarR family transcriptional regulator